MGRIPTGRPKGRPKGTGRLGEVVRLTVRIPEDLYARFVAFAEGRSYLRGDPQLSDCARDAIAHYLACPDKRLTRKSTVPHDDHREQTINGTAHRSYSHQQTDNGTVPSVPPAVEKPSSFVQHNEQTINSAESPRESENGSAARVRQTAKSSMPLGPGPVFDPHKAMLGSPCKAGHRSHGEAGNLRDIVSSACVACATEKKAAKAQAVQRSGQRDGQQGSPLPFDASKFFLGSLCRNGHDYEGTGQSLKSLKGKQECRECTTARQRKARQQKARAKPQAQPVA
jgi:hypothetical protein